MLKSTNEIAELDIFHTDDPSLVSKKEYLDQAGSPATHQVEMSGPPKLLLTLSWRGGGKFTSPSLNWLLSAEKMTF